jgi:hypothetical protein
LGFYNVLTLGASIEFSNQRFAKQLPRFPLMFIEAFEHVLSDGSIPFLMPVENQGSTVAAIVDF